MRPGASVVPRASIRTSARSVSQSGCRPTAAIRPDSMTTVSASRMGLFISPESITATLVIPTFPPDWDSGGGDMLAQPVLALDFMYLKSADPCQRPTAIGNGDRDDNLVG